mmetsp:Transcript_15223/g.25087  ORF Transcript_15223/g.25087 Transcript_15223/m.25087 type:complete len:253 (-) Transcript_15223:231-989(-)|eukprot:CAMPEP_0184644208 /NCGR_PEP_ID=MMETSP0308-20130426/971_1 /TAXON_ID=38269 /ORGANISM="Gloeochaete witrockiana, Strain SAG 46.84" /LENGTH=252 /DNA_ID=CAMNT_0027072617 /DNA_START=152 /DNA_END=910 /DNA_ORIENTATION=+
MAGRLVGKIALITGGSVGVGRATAYKFAKEGASVAILDIKDAEGKAVAAEIQAKGGKAAYFHADISKEGDVQQAVTGAAAALGNINVLVNNAGVLGPKDQGTENLTEKDLDNVIGVNLKGPFFTTKYVVPLMRKAGGGSIVNISAVTGLVGRKGISPFCATKGAVRLMSKADAITYALDRIRVNSIHPGAIKSPLLDELTRNPGWEGVVTNVPLGYFGEAEDVANAILFLASEESKFITGAELAVDGGWTAK